ncbi:MAG: DUF86 domain-containing protein, partial [Chloroflexota bacterium]
MSPRDWQERLYDIIDAIAEIQRFLEGQSYETFKDDIKTQKAVELNFIIIGEAAARIPEEIEKTYPEIPWHLMRAMRNRLVHVYFEVDSLLVWETARND